MFFTDDDGTNVIQFGNGDIEVAHGVLADPTETFGSVAFIPCPPGEIGRHNPNNVTEECSLDVDRGVHTRLVFTDIKSIEGVINQLEKCKEAMLRDTNPPDTREVR